MSGFIVIFLMVIAMLIAVAISRSLTGKASKARREHEQTVEQRVQEVTRAIQQEEEEREAGGWLPTSSPQVPLWSNIAPSVPAATEPFPPSEPEVGWYQPADAVPPSPTAADAVPPSPTAPADRAPAEPMSGPQVITLPDELRQQVLDLMEQNHEVAAVRLVCDEMRVGILDAQKTVRTLAGLPSPF